MNKLDKAIAEVRAVRLADERADREEMLNEWRKNLSVPRAAYIFINIWDDMTFNEKEKIFAIYNYTLN